MKRRRRGRRRRRWRRRRRRKRRRRRNVYCVFTRHLIRTELMHILNYNIRKDHGVCIYKLRFTQMENVFL
jgi:hypothetical protein